MIKTLANDEYCFERVVDQIVVARYFQNIQTSKDPIPNSLRVFVNGTELPESYYKTKYSRQVSINPQPMPQDVVRLEYKCSSL